MTAAIDAAVTAFFSAFDNRDGPAKVAVLREVMRSDATVIRVGDGTVQAMALEAFIEPRAKLLSDGTLTRFHEWEVESSTFVFGRMATRVSRYEKDGLLSGAPYRGAGWKSFQLVCDDSTWRIASLTWADEEPGLALSDAAWTERP